MRNLQEIIFLQITEVLFVVHNVKLNLAGGAKQGKHYMDTESCVGSHLSGRMCAGSNIEERNLRNIPLDCAYGKLWCL